MVTPISDNDGKMKTKDFLDACWQTICNKHQHEDQRLSPCQIFLLHALKCSMLKREVRLNVIKTMRENKSLRHGKSFNVSAERFF